MYDCYTEYMVYRSSLCATCFVWYHLFYFLEMIRVQLAFLLGMFCLCSSLASVIFNYCVYLLDHFRDRYQHNSLKDWFGNYMPQHQQLVCWENKAHDCVSNKLTESCRNWRRWKQSWRTLWTQQPRCRTCVTNVSRSCRTWSAPWRPTTSIMRPRCKRCAAATTSRLRTSLKKWRTLARSVCFSPLQCFVCLRFLVLFHFAFLVGFCLFLSFLIVAKGRIYCEVSILC